LGGGDNSYSFNRARSIPTSIPRPKSALNGEIPEGIATDALYENNTGPIFCAHSSWLVQTVLSYVIRYLFCLSTFEFPAGCIGLQKMCLICSNLHNSVISLFLKAVPPSVSMAFITPYRHIISRYKIEAFFSAVVDLQRNASHQSVVASTSANKCRKPSTFLGW